MRLANASDFTGGLNLRSDPFQLADNESPEMLNVDVDPRGGLRQRKVAKPFAGAIPIPVGATVGPDLKALAAYETTGGIKQIVGITTDGAIRYTTGGAWTTLTTIAAGSVIRTATFKDRLYIQTGVGAALRWDGATLATLGSAWNNTITNPTPAGAVGNMPRAQCIAVHQGCVFIGGTAEGANSFPNRIRWSHPNSPEDFRDTDYIDIDTGSDGDVITAMISYGDRLLVFKRRSIHAVYGEGPDGFHIYPVTREVGTISQESVTNTDVGLYFVSWPEGVMRYTGKNPEWAFEKIYPAIQDGSIPDARQGEIALGWGNRRLWVAVPWSSSTKIDRTYVLDPSLGRTGSWVQYDLKVGPFLEWKPPGDDAVLLAGAIGKGRLVVLDQPGTADDFGAGPVHIVSKYRTKWYDLKQPGVKKRWRRPAVVVLGGAQGSILVQSFEDYDPTNSTRSFRLSTKADNSALVWDSGTWDAGAWGRFDGDRNEIQEGSSLGTARAICLLFNGPDINTTWGINNITLKYTPKKP